MRADLDRPALHHLAHLAPQQMVAHAVRRFLGRHIVRNDRDDRLHAGLEQDRIRDIVVRAVAVVKGDHDRPVGHRKAAVPDGDQVGRQQRRVAELLQEFHIQPEALAGDCHAVGLVRVVGQVVIHQNRHFPIAAGGPRARHGQRRHQHRKQQNPAKNTFHCPIPLSFIAISIPYPGENVYLSASCARYANDV